MPEATSSLRTEKIGHQLVAAGEVFLLQTDCGITPVSVAGGSVNVKDKLRAGFTIVAIEMNS